MRFLTPCLVFGLAAIGAGCSTSTPETPEEDEGCDVSLMTLEDTQWVMWEAMPGGKARENPRARMKFYAEDETLKVDYSVGSPYAMYTYNCQLAGDEVKCHTDPRLVDWCLSLEVNKAGDCTPANLRKMAGLNTELKTGEIVKARKEALAMYEAAKEKGKENPAYLKRFEMSQNTLANKLQGRLDIRVRESKCQLVVTDQYMTMVNGEQVVDSNPVGTNPFVENDDTWLYENCKEGKRFLALAQETRPTDEELKAIDPERRFGSADTVHYHYIGTKNLKAEEGCTYSADLWSQWKPKDEGVEMQVVDCDRTIPSDDDPKKGETITRCVQWSSSHVWKDEVDELDYVSPDENAVRAFYGMTRYKTCEGGERKKLDTICASARIVEM